MELHRGLNTVIDSHLNLGVTLMKLKQKRRSDPQRLRVHRAEAHHTQASNRTIALTPWAHQRFVDDLLAQKLVRRKLIDLSGRYNVIIRFRRRGSKYSICRGPYLTIELGGDHLGFKLAVLHELAHALTWRTGKGDAQTHSWGFCEIYLFLIRRALGIQAEAEMKQLFKTCRVRWRKPRENKQPPLTPLQKEALLERLRRGKLAAEMGRAFGQPASEFKRYFTPNTP